MKGQETRREALKHDSFLSRLRTQPSEGENSFESFPSEQPPWLLEGLWINLNIKGFICIESGELGRKAQKTPKKNPLAIALMGKKLSEGGKNSLLEGLYD